LKICEELGIEPTVEEFSFEDDNHREIVAIELNLARRQMGPVTWGKWFSELLDRKGVKRGRGGDRKSTAILAVDPISEAAAKQGVPERTASRRLELADLLEDRPVLREWVDGPTKFPQQAALTIVNAHPDLAERIEAEKISVNDAKQAYQKRHPERPRATPPVVEEELTVGDALRKAHEEGLQIPPKAKMPETQREGYRTLGWFMGLKKHDL
jgi:hypothetical protein